MYDESGKYLLEQLGAWTRAIRKQVDACGFTERHLLVHVYEQWGLAGSIQLESLTKRANGIWASRSHHRGSALGHACSTVTMMNLIRLGNKTVLEQYNCTALRKASQKDARNTTGLRHTGCVRRTRPRHGLCDAKLFSHEERVQHGQVFSRKALMRMTTLASPQTVADRIKNLLEDPQFTAERGKRMLQMMLMLSLMLSTMAS